MNDHIVWHHYHIDKAARRRLNGHGACVLWYTGLSGSGKSTIANAVEQQLYARGCHTYLLDGDNIRHGLCKDLGFGEADRQENIRRIGEVARLFVDAGLIVSSAFISPFKADRAAVRALLAPEEFIEIYVDTPLELCQQRDPKGLYQKALAGEIENFTGISSPYEAPQAPDIHLPTDKLAIADCVSRVLRYLEQRQLIPPESP